ncbi:hypothetical protein BH20ACI2_BH20ACI2_17250 [soil metagenome]
MIRNCLSLILFCLLSGGVHSQVKQDPAVPANFKSDGCSLFPDGNYRECCVEHDKTYLIGGSFKARTAADKELYACVRSKGNGKFLASMIFVGVRIGGVSFLPTPFRWGFGNKYPHKEPPKSKTKSATGR